MDPKPKRRKNIQVLAIIDRLRQILDAYDGGIDSYSGDEDEDEINYNYSDDEEGNDRTEYTESENKRANFLDKMAHKFKWAARYEYDTGKKLDLYNPQDGSDSDVMSEDNQIDDTGVAKKTDRSARVAAKAKAKAKGKGKGANKPESNDSDATITDEDAPKKKTRKPNPYQTFVGEQMKLPEIKAINPFKERMAVVVMLWKKKKEEDKNAHKETKQPEAK